MNMDTIKEIDVKSVMTKSSLPVGGYSVNPYVGCPHACRYCYASFMKRFTGHTEPWGTFLDVKNWKPITNPHKYDGERVVMVKISFFKKILIRWICGILCSYVAFCNDRNIVFVQKQRFKFIETSG